MRRRALRVALRRLLHENKNLAKMTLSEEFRIVSGDTLARYNGGFNVFEIEFDLDDSRQADKRYFALENGNVSLSNWRVSR